MPQAKRIPRELPCLFDAHAIVRLRQNRCLDILNFKLKQLYKQDNPSCSSELCGVRCGARVADDDLQTRIVAGPLVAVGPAVSVDRDKTVDYVANPQVGEAHVARCEEALRSCARRV